MHWADVIARDLISRTGSNLISTGITPSGTLHVGTLREAITAEAVRKAVVKAEGSVRMIYLVDSIDPLRKRYPFLPENFEAEVGKPLAYIPCPCGEHKNYAHHYIQPFLDSIQELGIHCDVLWTHEQYEQGRFADVIDTAIVNKERVADILKEVSLWPFRQGGHPQGRWQDAVAGGMGGQVEGVRRHLRAVRKGPCGRRRLL